MILNFQELLQTIETEYASRKAFCWIDENTENVISVNYAQFSNDVRCCCTCIRQYIRNKRAHIAILARNSYEYIVYLFAGLVDGNVMIPLNYLNSTDELLNQIELSETEILLYDEEMLALINDSNIQLRHKILLKMEDDFTSFPPSFDKRNIDVDELAMIIFTSGTTGNCKGVMHSQKSIFYAVNTFIQNFSKALNDNNRDSKFHASEFMCAPFYHVLGLFTLILRPVRGETVCFCFHTKLFAESIERLDFNFFAMVPATMNTFLKMIRKGSFTAPKTIYIVKVGASAEASVIQDLRSRGFFVMNFYGMTETFTCGTGNLSQEYNKTDSIGKIGIGMEYKIEDNELCFRGNGVMMGYYHNPEATDEVMDSDGWFHTGDLVRVDGDGYFYIIGRKKNIIILSNGENINPEEVESHLLTNDKIEEVVVKEKNDKLCAEIYCLPDNQTEIKNFIRITNGNFGIAKQVTLVEFRDTPFEKTASGKIKRC